MGEQPLLVILGFIDVEERIVHAAYGIVGGEDHRRTLLAQQVYAETVVDVVDLQQPQQRRSYVGLSAQVVDLARLDGRGGIDEQRHVVETEGHVAAGCPYQLPVVAHKDKDGVVEPLLPAGLGDELLQSVVGKLDDAQLVGVVAGLEIFGHHIGRVVADAQQGGKEGLALAGRLGEYRQGILVEEVVLHAEAVDHLLLGIIFLGKDAVETVGAQVAVHVVVLRLVRHEEEGAVSVVLQDGGQSGKEGDDGPLHRVAFHQSRVGVQRGVDGVVGVRAGREKSVEAERFRSDGVEEGGQLPRIAEVPHQLGRHRFHEDEHHILAGRFARVLYPAGDGRHLGQRVGDVVFPAHAGDGLQVVHELNLAVLRFRSLQRAAQQIEGRAHTQLIQKRIVAIVGRTHLDGVVAHPAPDAEHAAAYQHDGAQQHEQLVGPVKFLVRYPMDVEAGALPQPAEQKDKENREGEEEHEGDDVGELAEHQPQCGTRVAEPVEYRGVDMLEEVGKVGYVGRRYGKGQHVEEGEEDAHAPEQRLPVVPQQGTYRYHRERQYHDVAGHHIVEPHAPGESLGTGEYRQVFTRQVVVALHEQYQAERGKEKKPQQMYRNQIAQGVQISFHRSYCLNNAVKIVKGESRGK